MRFLIICHAFQESFHPQDTGTICWPGVYAKELADLRTKHLDRRIVAVHLNRERNEGIQIIRNGIFVAGSSRVVQLVRFVADRPEQDRMDWHIGIIAYFAENTFWVAHEVHPV